MRKDLIKRSVKYDKNLSAQKTQTQDYTWISSENDDKRRPQGACKAQSERPQSPYRISGSCNLTQPPIMQKDKRISKNGHFNYVFRHGRRSACSTLALTYVKAHRTQVGFSVSKKVGNAVTRNKIKRRLRECFRKKLPCVKKGYYVFTAREKAAYADYWALSKDMNYLLKRMNLLNDSLK